VAFGGKKGKNGTTLSVASTSGQKGGEEKHRTESLVSGKRRKKGRGGLLFDVFRKKKMGRLGELVFGTRVTSRADGGEEEKTRDRPKRKKEEKGFFSALGAKKEKKSACSITPT